MTLAAIGRIPDSECSFPGRSTLAVRGGFGSRTSSMSLRSALLATAVPSANLMPWRKCLGLMGQYSLPRGFRGGSVAALSVWGAEPSSDWRSGDVVGALGAGHLAVTTRFQGHPLKPEFAWRASRVPPAIGIEGAECLPEPRYCR